MAAIYQVAAKLVRLFPGSRALGLASYWRDLGRLANADAVVVSFPKSGRTFVRVMLARLYQLQFGINEREALNFATLRRTARNVPRLLFTHDGDAMRGPGQISINRKAYEGRRVAILARHPGDVAVSRYYHLKHRSRDPARQKLAQQPLEKFVWTEQGGIPSIVSFLNGWAAVARERPDLLIVRYEDFLNSPNDALAKLAVFVGLASDDRSISDAVEFARFDNLKKLEREGYFTSKRLGARAAGNDQSYKVRTGISGGFRAQLSSADQLRIRTYIQKNLDPMFNYEC